MDPTESLGLSPFLVLDAKIAFLISQMETTPITYARNIGPLGLVGAYTKTNSKFIHNEDQIKIDRYVLEYLPKENHDLVTLAQTVDQVIVFGETIVNENLWKKLNVGGWYILATDKGSLKIELDYEEYEAFGKRWPFGESTEFGWKFKEEEWGLLNYEFLKIRKLS